MAESDDDRMLLIADLRRRDPAAWSLAVERQLGQVYGFVFHLSGGDPAVAEDLTQETWLEAIETLLSRARSQMRSLLGGLMPGPGNRHESIDQESGP